MHKGSFFMIVATCVALVIIGGLMITFLGKTNAPSTAGSPTVGQTMVTSPPGVPAIQPTISGAIPSYTLADVATYIQTQHLLRTTSGTSPVITNSEFITAQQASALINGESIGRPDNALVCYVALQGPFQVNVPAPPGSSLPDSNTAYEVFDAQTGNLLLWGV